jgi:rare lipoprotein A
MNRVLSIMAATLLVVANLGAATVPDHPQQTAKKPASKLAKTAPKVEAKAYQVGNASWYGKQFHGRTTASGEDFDMFELTAAHRRLPLGTFVKVTNLRNGKWIIVRVNDRGPYVSNRIMDLSYSAARMLSFRDGIERVRLDLIQPKNVASSQAYSSR